MRNQACENCGAHGPAIRQNPPHRRQRGAVANQQETDRARPRRLFLKQLDERARQHFSAVPRTERTEEPDHDHAAQAETLTNGRAIDIRPIAGRIGAVGVHADRPGIDAAGDDFVLHGAADHDDQIG